MILMTGLLISLGYFLQNIRSNYKRMRLASNNRIRSEEQKKILEHTSEDLHDDLGNKITRISVLTDVLERKLEKGDIEKRKLINQIRENAQALYIGTKDIIWSLTPGTDNLFDLLEKCRLTGVHLFADTEIEFETKGISPSFSDVPLPFPVIRNLSMVVKEAFTNILRHSGASKAMMRVQFVSQHTFQIEITDNGRGQDTPLNISGHGVLNMHTRMDRIGGTITVGNGTDGGFKIVLSIKIPLKEG
jgi:signal transduction histidine kinase